MRADPKWVWGACRRCHRPLQRTQVAGLHIRCLRAVPVAQRLEQIRNIIVAVDDRALAVDGPVPPTRQMITDEEIRDIYLLAGGRP